MGQAATKLLTAGFAYVVTRTFVDYDGAEHPLGETWVFRRYNFLPYDDGLSLYVSPSEGIEWHIRMQWRVEEQGAVIENFDSYVREIIPNL